jgi:FkbM family methyltransferase
MKRSFLSRFAGQVDLPNRPRPYLGEELVRVDSDAGPIWLPRSDGVMRPYLEARGTWEPEEGALLSRFFKPGLRFLDVGANVGYFSLLVGARCRDAVIHAFEPHPLTSEILALNAWASGRDITSYAMALSAGDRMLALTTADSNLGDTRSRLEGTATMLSPAAPLDEVLPDAKFDLVKIDVQGFEAEVIAGMSAMISRTPSVVIVAEFWPQALRERGLDPVAVLRDYETAGLDVRVQVDQQISQLRPVEIVRICEEAGAAGQVNLILTPVGS